MRLDHLLSKDEKSKALEVLLFNYEGFGRLYKILVAIRLRATPVPISNTMVKTQEADGTALVTVWESRWPPNLKKKKCEA